MEYSDGSVSGNALENALANAFDVYHFLAIMH